MPCGASISILRLQGSALALAAVGAQILAKQYGASGFEFLRKDGHGLAGIGDVLAMRIGFLRGAVDLGGAVADRNE